MSQAASATYSYDEVPYTSWPYAQSHPDRLAMMAKLFGLKPQPVDRAAILELGCASGGNLIPMAASLPGSWFVGIELSARQLAQGQATVEGLGLVNLELLHKNILDVGPELGKFHYILVHGVYSWVPEEVQEKIMAICAENLEPGGVAYVSYNTYPGWRMRQMLRDMLCYHTRDFRDPRERAGHARALLGFLSEKVPTENNPYGLFLKQEVEEFARYDDHYLLHDHLEEVNAPVYFHEFMERAGRHNLQYLGESNLGVMSTGNFPPEVEAVLRRLAKDVVQTEQYMDFLRNRQFRQTLLCHADEPLAPNLDAGRLMDLLVASPLQPQPSKEGPPGMYEFRGPRFSLRTGDPLFASALTYLAEAWPRWCRFRNCW